MSTNRKAPPKGNNFASERIKRIPTYNTIEGYIQGRILQFLKEDGTIKFVSVLNCGSYYTSYEIQINKKQNYFISTKKVHRHFQEVYSLLKF